MEGGIEWRALSGLTSARPYTPSRTWYLVVRDDEHMIEVARLVRQLERLPCGPRGTGGGRLCM